VRVWAATTVCLVGVVAEVAGGVADAQVAVAGVVVVEVPVVVVVDGLAA
jgi:hypothetical protein